MSYKQTYSLYSDTLTSNDVNDNKVKQNGDVLTSNDVSDKKVQQNGDVLTSNDFSGKQCTRNGDAAICVPSNNGELPAELQRNQERAVKPRFWHKWCRHGCPFWCRKYFWEGQLQGDRDDIIIYSGEKVKITPLQRKLLAILLPALVMHFLWWAVMIKKNLWYLFPEKYYMSITMIFGSMVAGMTSEGGGAIAFPVMTLAFNVAPSIARDFSVMIQSFGMTCAAFTLVYMKVHVEKTALVWCSLGGVFGVIFGLEVVDVHLTPPQKKMGFVSIWFSFAFALFLLNRHHKRPTFYVIQHVTHWKRFVLLLTGVLGGCFTSFAGSGLDICCFSFLTLLFRLSEKVATPTSVVLMAINTLVCFFWRGLIANAIAVDAWEYVMVCIPIVVFGAPFGSLIGTHFHRLVLAALIYVIDTVALVSAFAIVPQTPILAGVSVAIIVFGSIVFLILTYIGQKLIPKTALEQEELHNKTLHQTTGETNEAFQISISDSASLKEATQPSIAEGENTY